MAAPQQQRRQAQPMDLDNAAELLQKIIDGQGNRNAATVKIVNHTLDSIIQRVEDLLPENIKGSAKRFTLMAKAYFSGDPNLAACPPEEFVRAVSRAATAGFALDGKLAYCVPYGGKSSKWSLQLDYKAIVAVARRSKIILDCEAEIVHKNDDFSHGRKDGVSFLNHTWPLGADRGPVIGAWARVTLPDGRWRYDLMDLAELDYIASLSPMGPDKGPWKKHRGEMQKKTVIRRLLKMYTDDPQFAAVLNAEEYPEEPEETPTPTRNDSYTMPNGRHSLRRDASAAMEYVDPPPPENNDRAAAEAAHQAAETADRQPGEDKDD